MDADLRKSFDKMVEHVDDLKGEIVALREDMATKQDLARLQKDMGEEFESMRADMLTKEDVLTKTAIRRFIDRDSEVKPGGK